MDKWNSSDDIDVVDDVDIDAFRDKARSYLEDNLKGDQLDVYKAIRETAE